MTGPGAPRPSTGIPRAALERVLARAAALQAASGDGEEAGAISEQQLVELGKEVGISGDVLRQALAEERSRTLLPTESGWLAALTGASAVTASRTVPGSPASVLAALDAWMQRSEALQVKRRFTDQLVWEARHDFFSLVRRSLPIWGRGVELVPANEVSAIVADVGPNRSHARLVADFRVARSQRAATGTALAVAMLLFTAPLLVMGVAPLVAVMPPALGALLSFVVTRRQYRQVLARAQVALEQALDRLEFAESKPPNAAQALLDAFTGTPRQSR